MATTSVNRSSQPASRYVILALGVTAHATASKIVIEFGSLVFKSPTAQIVAIWSFTVMIVINSIGGRRDDSQMAFITLCLTYAVATLIVFITQKRTGTQLPEFMRDMTEAAKAKVEQEKKRFPDKVYVPLIGNEDALELALMRLLSETNRSLVFVGQPGVGKTCLVDRIVEDVARGTADRLFADCRFIHVSANEIRAGTGLKGDEEGRIREMLKLARNDRRIIYLVDEIDLLTTGEGYYGTNIARTLYEAMGKGELTLWGTTNPDRHRARIANTPMDRRLPKIDILEPTPFQCYQRLKVRFSDLARADTHYKVSDEALKVAIIASIPMPGAFPDKVIELLDQAIAQAKLTHRNPVGDVVVGLNDVAIVAAKKFPSGGTAIASKYTQFIARIPDFFLREYNQRQPATSQRDNQASL